MAGSPDDGKRAEVREPEVRITGRALAVGAAVAVVFSFLNVYFEHRQGLVATATQIAVLPYVLLLATVLLLNPLCGLLRVIRRFTLAEILTVFIMGSVSSGIASFGLMAQLVPITSGLFNRGWNNDQSEWNRYVEPYLDESFFVSVPGIQKAAQAYRVAFDEARVLREVHEAADRRQSARRLLAAVETAAAGLQARTGAHDTDRVRAQQDLENARRADAQAQAEWVKHGSVSRDPDGVLAAYPDRIRAAEQTLAARKLELRALEQSAFERVQLFRRGLPETQRAFPGFVPVTGESAMMYRGRFRRLVHGTSARRELERAQVALAAFPPDQPLPAAAAAALRASADAAVGRLGRADTRPAVIARQQEIDADWRSEQQRLLRAQADLAAARTARRAAPASEFRRIDGSVSRLARDERRRARALAELKREREQAVAELAIIGRMQASADRIAALGTRAGDGAATPRELAAELRSIVEAFPSFDASLRRYLLSDIPWGHWTRPLLCWSFLIVITYTVLMAFNLLIFRQWAKNEKLIYPLAELPEILAGRDPTASIIPPVFRNGLFWVGFAISASVLGWNLLCLSQAVPGLQRFDLENKWATYIANGPLRGLYPDAKSEIFFTMIGLAFLIPAKISFSLWLFSVLYMVQLLILVWSGHGSNENSFPCEWMYILNFRTAEGGGALMVFAAAVFYKCRKYLFCCCLPQAVRELDPAEQRELRSSSFLFLVGSVALILGLWLGLGANLAYTLFAYLVIMMITIGLVRAVAEGGILGFQAWVNPFHLIRTLFGMDKAWTAPHLFTPLLVYFSVLFLDIKTFIAPAMANSIKIRDDLRLGRARFHIAIVLCILFALFASVAAHLMLGYSRGADAMNGWFYSTFPKSLYDQMASMAKTLPVDASANRLWMGFGAALMGGLLYFRQICFWLPHPIGLIMLVNPMMKTYWFSIFLGWLAKSAVTKYGNKDTYDRVKNLFIGLIVGELVLVVLALVVSLFTDAQIPIHLNRN